MSAHDDIRRQWVTAVLEGRFATADFLSAQLPPPDAGDLIHIPEGERDTWGVCGEIETDGRA
jgi:hypothetical protein